MSEYKRFIAYFYEYINGEKQKNAGFAKVELRNGMWRILFRLTIAEPLEAPIQVFGFAREGGYLLGIPLGAMNPDCNAPEEWAWRTDTPIGKENYYFEQMNGIRIASGDGREFFTVWDDEPMNPGRFVMELPGETKQPELAEAEKPEESGQSGEAKMSEESGQSGEPEMSEESGQPGELEMSEESGQSGELEMSEESGQSRELEVPEQSEEPVRTEKPKEQDISVFSGQPERPLEIEPQPEQSPEIEPLREPEIEPLREPEQPSEIEPLREPEQPPEIEPLREPEQPLEIEPLQEPEQSPEIEPLQEPELSPESRSSQEPVESLASDTFQNLESQLVAEVAQSIEAQKISEVRQASMKIRNADRKKKNVNWNRPDKSEQNPAERLLQSRQRFRPFRDDEFTECVQIKLCDILPLQQENWKVGRNNFLQHGYYLYRHLLLGRTKVGSYILGVPGTRNQQEEYMAQVFGYEHFKMAASGSCGRRFGYWYRIVEAPERSTEADAPLMQDYHEMKEKDAMT